MNRNFSTRVNCILVEMQNSIEIISIASQSPIGLVHVIFIWSLQMAEKSKKQNKILVLKVSENWATFPYHGYRICVTFPNRGHRNCVTFPHCGYGNWVTLPDRGHRNWATFPDQRHRIWATMKCGEHLTSVVLTKVVFWPLACIYKYIS